MAILTVPVVFAGFEPTLSHRHSMPILVRIPTPLRRYTGGKSEVEVQGSSVREVFASIEAAHAGIREKVFDDTGAVRRFINIFVNGEDIRYLKGPETSVKSGDEVSIVPAIAGGGAASCPA
jgi:molybdopterin synthase sulfur carrier subunit